MDTLKFTVKCCISSRDKGMRFLCKEYFNYKKSIIAEVQKSVRSTIKESTANVYAQQKWMLDTKLKQYLKNLPLHPMPFHNQSVWLEEKDKDRFSIFFRNKQLQNHAPIECNLIVPSKYKPIIRKACGKNNIVLGQVELIEDNQYGRFNVHLLLRLPKPEVYKPSGWVGVDVGWNCLAVSAFVTEKKVSDVGFHGKEYKTQIIQLKHLIKEYQRSNRSWKKWKYRLQNTTKYVTGYVAKQIVYKAKKHKAGIVMEDLTFNSHTKQWLIPKYKLKCAIQTLCERKQIPFMLVNARNTSITCNKCGNINKVSRVNKNFKCVECGYMSNADYNAAVNIARKALLPMATCSRLKSKKLHASVMGELPTPSVASCDLKPSMNAMDVA